MAVYGHTVARRWSLRSNRSKNIPTPFLPPVHLWAWRCKLALEHYGYCKLTAMNEACAIEILNYGHWITGIELGGGSKRTHG